MSTIVTRAGKGSPLTNTELDSNFTNLNTDKAELSGANFTGNLSLGDNVKLQLGNQTDGDLQIYHDGSNSIISDVGEGSLQIQSTAGLALQDSSGNNFAVFTDEGTGGKVELYKSSTVRLTTTTSGIDVTGSVTADGLTVDGNGLIQANMGAKLEIKSTDNFINNGEVVGSLDFISADYNYTAQPIKGQIRTESVSSTGESAVFISTTETTNLRDRIKIDKLGDISFYEDTGTTPKFFWDASAESLSIGATAGTTDRRFQVTGTGASNSTSQFGIVNNPTFSTAVTSNLFNLYTGPNLTSGTTLTNLYNLYLEVNNRTGSTVANSYGLYQAGSSDKNYFAGRVGIGTNLPAYPLDIVGDRARIAGGTTTTFAGFEVENSNGFGTLFGTGGSGRADLLDNRGFISAQSATSGLAIGTEGAAPVVFYTSGTTQERMRIDSSGNVQVKGGQELRVYRGDNATYGSMKYLTGSGGLQLNDKNGDGISFVQADGATEYMRIDSSGNLLVGTTSITPQTGDHGFVARANGYTIVSVDNARPMLINRATSDGELIKFSKNSTTTVGSIGASGGDLVIGTGDTGIHFHDGVDSLIPWNVTTASYRDAAIDLGTSTYRFKDLYLSGKIYGSTLGIGDAGIQADQYSNAVKPFRPDITSGTSDNYLDLGTSSVRWKDLYLSGGVYLGGTGSANKLSDFETGTFTPVMENVTGWSGSSGVSGTYTKIGNTVHVFITMTSNVALTGTPTYKITGLPFSSDLSERCANVSISRMFGINLTTTDYIAGVAGTEIHFSYVNADNNVNNLTHSGSTLRLTLSATYTTAA